MTAPVVITGKVVGASEVKARFAAIRESVPELLASSNLAPFLVQRMQERFKKEQSPDGGSWKPLSPQTKAGPQILWQTRSLYDSIGLVDKGQRRGGSATGFGFRVGIRSQKHTETFKNSSRVVDTVVYGRAHQQGLGVPKRRFIGINEGDVRLIANKLRQQLSAAVRGV